MAVAYFFGAPKLGFGLTGGGAGTFLTSPAVALAGELVYGGGAAIVRPGGGATPAFESYVEVEVLRSRVWREDAMEPARPTDPLADRACCISLAECGSAWI